MAKKKPKKVTTEKKKAIMKKATEYEKKVAQRHRAKQIGGAGKPDYQRGSTKGEVKNRKTPVTKPELKKIAKKNVTEVESKAGFTKPAIKYRDRYKSNIKLFQKGKIIPKKKKK
ncbi:hypothetical protein LCGC14_1000440 [marine sediment metagenome]|uniref:Uncharacterized protein n=1 Tax=marine sediment metagenome TaxID=412755 RepID=A0A0F9N368_9ZZZZ